MSVYGLDELQSGLEDLLKNKAALLAQLPSAEDYTAGFQAMLDEVLGKAPGAHRLPEQPALTADRHHDALLRYVRRHLETLATYPDLTEDQAARIRRLLSLVPAYDEATAQWADEVAGARRYRARLPELEADLKAIPFLDGKTLYGVFVEYLDAAEDIDRGLNQQAQAKAARVSRKGAAQVAASVTGRITKLRSAITVTVELSSKLPQDLPRNLFSYFDELDRLHTQRLDSRKRATAQPGDGAADPPAPPVISP